MPLEMCPESSSLDCFLICVCVCVCTLDIVSGPHAWVSHAFCSLGSFIRASVLYLKFWSPKMSQILDFRWGWGGFWNLGVSWGQTQDTHRLKVTLYNIYTIFFIQYFSTFLLLFSHSLMLSMPSKNLFISKLDYVTVLLLKPYSGALFHLK